jgi:hypothetical protein
LLRLASRNGIMALPIRSQLRLYYLERIQPFVSTESIWALKGIYLSRNPCCEIVLCDCEFVTEACSRPLVACVRLLRKLGWSLHKAYHYMTAARKCIESTPHDVTFTHNVADIARGILEKGAFHEVDKLRDACEDDGCLDAVHHLNLSEHWHTCWLLRRLYESSRQRENQLGHAEAA